MACFFCGVHGHLPHAAVSLVDEAGEHHLDALFGAKRLCEALPGVGGVLRNMDDRAANPTTCLAQRHMIRQGGVAPLVKDGAQNVRGGGGLHDLGLRTLHPCVACDLLDGLLESARPP